jgi:hypothetical protein
LKEYTYKNICLYILIQDILIWIWLYALQICMYMNIYLSIYIIIAPININRDKINTCKTLKHLTIYNYDCNVINGVWLLRELILIFRFVNICWKYLIRCSLEKLQTDKSICYRWIFRISGFSAVLNIFKYLCKQNWNQNISKKWQ